MVARCLGQDGVKEMLRYGMLGNRRAEMTLTSGRRARLHLWLVRTAGLNVLLVVPQLLLQRSRALLKTVMAFQSQHVFCSFLLSLAQSLDFGGHFLTL